MIPKIIHYCWFGTAPKPEGFAACLASWELHCPDYEIKEWNETNSKALENAFYKNALRKKKYAFAADYIRTKVLFEYGGIYMDTDMVVVKPLDALLTHDFFIGEEVKDRMNFALFGARKGHPIMRSMVQFYDENYFDGFSLPVITHKFSPLILENLGPKDILFDTDYFYPQPYEDRGKDYIPFIRDNTYAVHLWDHSWKVSPELTKGELLRRLKEVCLDFLFYSYPYPYFKRYFREYLRKLYHLLKG